MYVLHRKHKNHSVLLQIFVTASFNSHCANIEVARFVSFLLSNIQMFIVFFDKALILANIQAFVYDLHISVICYNTVLNSI